MEYMEILQRSAPLVRRSKAGKQPHNTRVASLTPVLTVNWMGLERRVGCFQSTKLRFDPCASHVDTSLAL